MPTLADALATGVSARLSVGPGPGIVEVFEDITGEYSATLRYGMGPTRLMGRFSSFAELESFLRSGAIPGVDGAEITWEPVFP